MDQAGFDPRAVANAYIEAVGEHDLDRAAQLLHEDLQASVRDKIFTKAEWLGALQRLLPIVARNEIRQTIVHQDDEAFVVYDFVTDTPVGPVPSAELLTFQDGKIRTIRLAFETARWPEVLEALVSRAVPA